MPQPLRESRTVDLWLWLLRRRWRLRVTEASMLPALKPGDEVLVNPYAYQQRSPEPSELVVAQHPQKPKMRLIKRVLAVEENGDCFLIGDNLAESTDSREFGAVPHRLILGQVVCLFP